MSNGKMDDAQKRALMVSDPDAQIDYLLTCVQETRRAVEAIPGQIAVAIASQRKRDFRRIAATAAAIATIISLATPYLLKLC